MIGFFDAESEMGAALSEHIGCREQYGRLDGIDSRSWTGYAAREESSATQPQVVITNGTQQALDICARLLLKSGDQVAVEDPGYEAARAAFAAAGATIVPIAVDDEGLNPAKLPNTAGVRAVYVTPSHQFPTGAVLSAPRRLALLGWAKRRRAFMVEDDYDGEIRYQGQRTGECHSRSGQSGHGVLLVVEELPQL